MVARDTPSCGRRVARGGHTVPSCATGRGSGPCYAATVCHVRGAVWRTARGPRRIPVFVRACDSRRVRRGAPETKVRNPRPLSLSLSLSLRAPTRASRRRRTDATACGGVRRFPPGVIAPSPTRRAAPRPPPLAPEAPRRKPRKPPRRARADSDTIFSNRFAWY